MIASSNFQTFLACDNTIEICPTITVEPEPQPIPKPVDPPVVEEPEWSGIYWSVLIQPILNLVCGSITFYDYKYTTTSDSPVYWDQDA